jgi:hypothetical protein
MDRVLSFLFDNAWWLTAAVGAIGILLPRSNKIKIAKTDVRIKVGDAAPPPVPRADEAPEIREDRTDPSLPDAGSAWSDDVDETHVYLPEAAPHIRVGRPIGYVVRRGPIEDAESPQGEEWRQNESQEQRQEQRPQAQPQVSAPYQQRQEYQNQQPQQQYPQAQQVDPIRSYSSTAATPSKSRPMCW